MILLCSLVWPQGLFPPQTQAFTFNTMEAGLTPKTKFKTSRVNQQGHFDLQYIRGSHLSEVEDHSLGSRPSSITDSGIRSWKPVQKIQNNEDVSSSHWNVFLFQIQIVVHSHNHIKQNVKNIELLQIDRQKKWKGIGSLSLFRFHILWGSCTAQKLKSFTDSKSVL